MELKFELGEPTHKLLSIVVKELAANLMAVPCPWGHGKGHLGLLQDPVLYLQRNLSRANSFTPAINCNPRRNLLLI
jgi:hypothetical protein